MKCKICNNKIIINKNLLNLFSFKNYYLCNSCYKKCNISLSLEKIYINNYEVVFIVMFNKKLYADYNYFFVEYNQIIKKYNNYKDYKLLFFNDITLDDTFLISLELMTKLFNKKLLILTFTLKK